MHKIIIVLMIMVLSATLLGCGSSAGISRLNEGITAGSPTVATDIKVYAARDIGREYAELGSVSVSIHDELDGKVYIKRIKEEAAKIGADAIVGYEQLGTSAVGIAVKFR
jgi:hypothetical protein